MDLWTSLLLAASLQGFVLTVALAVRSEHRGPGDAPLGVLLLAFSLPLAEHAFIRSGIHLVDTHGFIVFVTTPLLFLPGPLFLAYARSLRAGRSAIPWIGPHLLPACLMAVNYAPAYAAIGASAIGLVPPIAGQLVWINPYVAWAAEIVQLAIYLALARPVLSGFESAVRDHVSRSTAVQAGGLRHLALILLGLAAVNLGALVFMLARRHVAEIEYVMALALALGVHFVAFMAVRDPRVFGWRFEATVGPIATEGPPATPYAKSGLTGDRRRAYKDRLVRVMEEEKPWLDENLTKADLARRAAIPSAHLSEVLSQELDTSFFEYVNAYRVGEASRLLTDPTTADRSILEIAMASGFSSKSSFNRVFKRVTGETPERVRRSRPTPPADTARSSPPIG